MQLFGKGRLVRIVEAPEDSLMALVSLETMLVFITP